MAFAPDAIERTPLSPQREFKAFLATRLAGNDAEVEDLLAHGLIKALRRATELRDNTKLTAWFHQILRRAIVEQVRACQAAGARDVAWTRFNQDRGPEDERAVCRCFESLLPGIEPRHATIFHLVELDGISVAAAAAALEITANHAAVLLYRARRELREALEEFCGDCAKAGHLDCAGADSRA